MCIIKKNIYCVCIMFVIQDTRICWPYGMGGRGGGGGSSM